MTHKSSGIAVKYILDMQGDYTIAVWIAFGMVVVCWCRIILCVRMAMPYERCLRLRIIISSSVALEFRQNSEVEGDNTVSVRIKHRLIGVIVISICGISRTMPSE